jgi:hypothetical protein
MVASLLEQLFSRDKKKLKGSVTMKVSCGVPAVPIVVISHPLYYSELSSPRLLNDWD